LADEPASRTPRRDLGLATCALLGLTTIVGSGIFALPPILARNVGPLSFLAFVAAAGIVLFIGLMTAEAAGTTDKTGGAYQYARQAFGAPVGFAVAWLAWINTILAWAGVSVALVKLLEPIHPWFADPTHARLAATLEIAALGLVNAAGAKPGAAVSNILTVAKLVPLAIFVVIGICAFDPVRFAGSGQTLAAAGAGGLAVAVYRCIYAAGGFENIGIIAGEVRNPQRAIPKAVVVAIAASSTLYAFVQFAAVSSVPDLAAVAPATGPGSLSLPLAAEQAATRIGSSAFGALIYQLLWVGAIVSMFGFCSGIALVSPRYLFAMAEDRFVPAALVRTTASGTPAVAVLAVTAVSIGLVWGADWLSMLDAAVLFSLCQHTTTVLSAWRLRSSVPKEGRFVAPGGALVPLAALILIAGLVMFAFRPPAWLAPYYPITVPDGVDAIGAQHFGALAVVLGLGALVAFVSRRTASAAGGAPGA